MSEEVCGGQSHEMKQCTRSIFKDMIKYAPSKICGILGNTALVPIYTNLLSPQQYGIYAISIAMLSFLCIIFSDWVGLSGLRFFKEHNIKDQIPRYLTTLVGLLASNVIVMFALSMFFRHSFYDFFGIKPKIFILVLFLVIPIAVRALLFQILRAQIKPLAFTISTVLNQIFTIVISVIVIKCFNLGGASILIGMFISICIIDIILVYQSKIFSYYKFEKPHFGILKSLFSYGVPLAVTSVSMWCITQSDKFILKRILNNFSDVGLVGVAYSLTFSILLTLFSIIPVAAVPRIINMYEEKHDVRDLISKLSGYFILAALPIITLIALYPQQIVATLAHAKFAGASILVPYLAFAAFFMALTEYTALQYHLAKKTYINMVIKIFAGSIGLLLNVLLIKKMGLVGVGIAAIITNFAYFVLTALITVQNLGWRAPYRDLTRILVSFLPFALLYFIFNNFFPIQRALQMISLFVFYYATYFTIRKFENLCVLK